MPKIDQLVDTTYGNPRMSFLDAYQGYHQIALATEDQEKTTFISLDANYHYTVMPFGLKNAGATYQRMMTRMFQDKMGHTVRELPCVALLKNLNYIEVKTLPDSKNNLYSLVA